MDIPSGVLAQLGLKIQYALRAFTANDRKAIKQTADNYTISDYYKIDQILTSNGIQDALVTALRLKGIAAAIAATMMRAPKSRMDVLTKTEIREINNKSKLVKKYCELIDRESAYEILNIKIAFHEQQLYQKEHDENSQKQQSSSSEKVAVVRKSV